MTTIALVGFAHTRVHAMQSQAEEIWTVQLHYIHKDIPKPTRVFDLHYTEEYSMVNDPHYDKYRGLWLWLQQPHDYPIYQLARDERVPGSVAYPLKEVIEDVFPYARWLRGGKPQILFTSSLAYMLALAIHEKPERIELYGFEMRVDSEFFYQRECVALLLGIAMGRGIQIYQPADSEFLFASRLYGYEGGGLMIDRQLLDNLRVEYTENEETKRSTYERLLGAQQALNVILQKAHEAYEKGDKSGWIGRTNMKQLQEAQVASNTHLIELQKARDAAVGAAHMKALLEKLLAEVDMEEPEHCKFELPAYLISE